MDTIALSSQPGFFSLFLADFDFATLKPLHSIYIPHWWSYTTLYTIVQLVAI